MRAIAFLVERSNEWCWGDVLCLQFFGFVDGEEYSVFDEAKRVEVEHLGERVHFLAPLWASTSPDFKEYSVSLISLAWNAVVL